MLTYRHDHAGDKARRGLMTETPKRTIKSPALSDPTLQEVVDKMKSGTTRTQLFSWMRSRFPGVKEDTLQVYFEHAMSEFTLEFVANRKATLVLHFQRYQQQIQETIDPEVPSWMLESDKIEQWKIDEWISKQYFECLAFLKQEEELLGLHQKKVKIYLNDLLRATFFSEEKTGVKTVSLLERVQTLQPVEQLRFLELLLKTKRSEDEVQGVILRKQEEKEEEDKESNIDDIPYVEVNDSIDHIGLDHTPSITPPKPTFDSLKELIRKQVHQQELDKQQKQRDNVKRNKS